MLGYRIPGSEITLGFKDRYVTDWLVSAATAIINLYVPSLGVAKSSSCCSGMWPRGWLWPCGWCADCILSFSFLDYKSFWENGFPAIGFFENPTTASSYPSYHTV